MLSLQACSKTAQANIRDLITMIMMHDNTTDHLYDIPNMKFYAHIQVSKSNIHPLCNVHIRYNHACHIPTLDYHIAIMYACYESFLPAVFNR